MKKIISAIFFCLFSFTANAVTMINDTETEKVLTELVKPLTHAANIPDSRLKINIVNSDEFNAFVSGGEEIFIYTGLLKQIKSPSALQAVIAHELGHTLGGHMVQMSARMSDEMTRTMIIQALGIGLMVAGGNPSLGAGVLAGSGGIAEKSILSFSRDEERMADDLGVDLMVRAKLNPNGFIEVFKQMNDMTGNTESKIDPTQINHPLTTERLKNVKNKIAKLKYKSNLNTEKKYEKEYSLVRAKLIGYLDEPKRVKTLYPYSDKSSAAIYARAISEMRVGNLEAAKTGALILIAGATKYPYFYELLGDIEYQYGHYDDSVKAYRKSLELSKDAPQIQTALALVLSDRKKPGDENQAIELCKRAILLQPQPLTYWVLASVYHDGKSDWARAEYYNLTGNKKESKRYAKKAQDSLPKNSPEYIKSGDLLK